MEEKYIEKIIETESRSKSNSKRLDEHSEKIEQLEKTYSIMEKMDYRMGKVEKSTEDINKKIDDLNIKSSEPTKQKAIKWDKFIDYLFYAVLAVALFRLGIK